MKPPPARRALLLAGSAAVAALSLVTISGCGGSGRRRSTTSSAAGPSSSAASEGSGRVLWEPQFDRSFTGWQRKVALPGGVTPLTRPVGGRRAVRFVVGPGDMPNPTGERAELVATPETTGGFDGAESWYAWSVLFPPDFDPSPNAFNIFTQWHRERSSTPECRPGPNVAFRTTANSNPLRMQMVVTGGSLVPDCMPMRQVFPLGPIEYNHWYDFVLHVRWSPDAAAGFVQVYIDGRELVPLTHAATMYEDDQVYAVQGIYRSPSDRTSTVYETPIRRGTTMAAVQAGP